MTENAENAFCYFALRVLAWREYEKKRPPLPLLSSDRLYARIAIFTHGPRLPRYCDHGLGTHIPSCTSLLRVAWRFLILSVRFFPQSARASCASGRHRALRSTAAPSDITAAARDDDFETTVWLAGGSYYNNSVVAYTGCPTGIAK